MKSYAIPFLLLLGLLCWTGCDDEDAATTATLNYDGPNVTAPQLPPGQNSFLVYFPPSETQPFLGRQLERVSFYLFAIPQRTSVVIYAEGDDDLTPGAELYRRDITSRVNSTGWIEDRLQDPIDITEDGIWLAIEVELVEGAPLSVGCDAGRNYSPNGDLLRLAPAPNIIRNFDDNVNWNIRGIISEQ